LCISPFSDEKNKITDIRLKFLNIQTKPKNPCFFLTSKIRGGNSYFIFFQKIRVDFLNRSLDEFVLTNEDLNLRPNSSVRLSLLKKVAFEEENNEEGGSNINPIEINEIERENEENIGGKTNNKVGGSKGNFKIIFLNYFFRVVSTLKRGGGNPKKGWESTKFVN